MEAADMSLETVEDSEGNDEVDQIAVVEMPPLMPQSLNLMKFAQSRAREIATVMQMVEKKLPKKASQQLPRHMRRRASSYNPKRVPKRLRERAVREIQANQVKSPKRPSRKYRRRPKNLLAEYNRRKRKHKWLETHIWFAKRFRMKEIWDYKLPLHSNDKSFRAFYRASFRHCLIQDLSYYGCIELKGPEDMILNGLDCLTSPDVGLTFRAKTFLKGDREGRAMLYHQNSYPFRVIGPAQFLWKPVIEMFEGIVIRQLWIWVHPLMYDELVEELQSVFGFDNISSKNLETTQSCDVAASNEDETTSDSVSDFFGKNGVKMHLLRDKLARFRLTGALSQAVLTSALDPVPKDFVEKPGWNWRQKYISLQAVKEIATKQYLLWNDLRCSPTEFLPPSSVIGLTVLDPRLRLPPKKTGITADNAKSNQSVSPFSIGQLHCDIAYSAIWHNNIRKIVTETITSQDEINKLRSQFLVPGTTLELENKENRIPIIVIKQAGSQDSQSPCYGFNSSWDVIMPSGWAVAFLISCVYRGARAAGLRDLQNASREAGTPLYPAHFPDSVGGQKTSKDCWHDCYVEYLKHPPAKRPSFEKLGVISPFYLQWTQLVDDWKEAATSFGCLEDDMEKMAISSSTFFVTRNRKVIQTMQKAFAGSLYGMSKVAKHSKLQKSVHDKAHHKERFNCALEVIKCLPVIHLKRALLTVQIHAFGKGCPTQFSLICVPLESDFLQLRDDASYSGPEEPIHKSTNAVKMKKNRKSKKKTLVELDDEIKSLDSTDSFENIRHTCSRQIIGFVETGDYSFFQSCGTGVGLCSLVGLIYFLQQCAEDGREPLILFRQQHSRKYHFGKLWPVMPF